jgi:hypothetical protein
MSVEQRSTIKLFVLNRKSNMETMDMSIKVYGCKAIKKIAMYRWYAWFQDRQKRVTTITAAVAENW